MSSGAMTVLAMGIALAVIALSLHLNRSWMGRVFAAVAQDDDAAQTLGFDVARYKLAAFMIGTASAGVAGALYAHITQLIVPDAFGFITSITILAILLTLMPELFRFVNEYKLLVYGGLLIVVMRLSPDGLAGIVHALAQRRRG
jgi:branched-chain amino acid transport system permease protein